MGLCTWNKLAESCHSNMTQRWNIDLLSFQAQWSWSHLQTKTVHHRHRTNYRSSPQDLYNEQFGTRRSIRGIQICPRRRFRHTMQSMDWYREALMQHILESIHHLPRCHLNKRSNGLWHWSHHRHNFHIGLGIYRTTRKSHHTYQRLSHCYCRKLQTIFLWNLGSWVGF